MSHQRQQSTKEKLLALLKRECFQDMLQQWDESNGAVIETWVRRPMDYWASIAGMLYGFTIYNIFHPPNHIDVPAACKL
jgi:hypothetical protein